MQEKELFLNELLMDFLKEEFENSEFNQFPVKYGDGRIFSQPLIGVARGDDPIFQRFKEIVGTEHYTPSEMWRKSGREQATESDLHVVSIIFPFVDMIRKEGITSILLPKVTLPAEIYSVARNFGKEFKNYIMRQTIDFFESKGYYAMAGKFSDAFTIIAKKNFYSTWSERHMAFVAGLGTFGLHEGIITEVGSNIRLA